MSAATDPVEVAWRGFRRHLDLAPDDPLVAYVFAEDSAPARRLLDRLLVAGRKGGFPVRVLAPATPGELVEALGQLFAPERALVAILGVGPEPGGAPPPPGWADAWAEALPRLNALRGRLLRELRGLVLVLPLAARARLVARGPDLWSVHHVVCELPAAPPGGVAERSSGGEATYALGAPAGPMPPGEPEAALAAAAAIEAREGRTAGWARTVASGLRGLVARGEGARAVGLARAAQRVLPRSDPAFPRLLLGLAEAEAATGDVAAAIAHRKEAAELAPVGDQDTWWGLVEAGRQLAALRLFDEAAGLAKEAQRRTGGGGAVPGLRALSAALDLAGDAAVGRGRWDEAASAYRESLALSRRLVELAGETPEALRDVSVSLNRVGDVAKAQGQWDEAASAYGESLALCRRLVGLVGETPEALRDLTLSLNRMGDVAEAQGRWGEAASAFGESLALCRRLVGLVGETPEAMRDLSLSLNCVGDVAKAQGRWDEAAGAYGESLALCLRLVGLVGETPEALRDLSVSLDSVGDVANAQGQWDEAAGAYGESLALCRRLLALVGETPEALRDLSVSLSRVGDLAKAQGRWTEAATAYEESAALARRLVALQGQTPQALRDLVLSLGRVASCPGASADVLAEARAVLAGAPADALPAQARADLEAWLSRIVPAP